MFMVSFLVYIYYNIVLAYSFHYLFSGFAEVLPWTKCDQWWNSAQTKGIDLLLFTRLYRDKVR